MKAYSQPCDPDRLRQLLDDRLDPAAQTAVERHLENCLRCRRDLDALAGGTAWQGDVRVWLAQGDEAAEGEDDLSFLGPADDAALLGTLGQYQIRKVLGRGGMSLVLQGYDPTLSRLVAIKVLSPQLAASAAGRRRFAREGKAAAAVVHEHVVPIHAVETTPQGMPYLVMAYVAGSSVQERVDRDGPPEVREILRIGLQTAQGLAAAHAQGVVHRDVKPANILLENGVERVQLTDFGLARVADEGGLTQDGAISGTPPYMAPEQTLGGPVDHRTDLFSLGGVLYFLCTGRAPFRGPTAVAIMRAVCEEEPPPIRALNPDVPEWLCRIIARLLAKKPADRYQAAAAVAEVLGQWLTYLQQPTAVAPPPVPPLPPAPRKARRWPAAALVTAGALAGALAALLLGLVVLRFPTPEGTLIVECDDPQVKVTLEDQDVVITGTGLQEIRLKPGVYKLRKEKAGAAQTELVSITQGGRRTVRVSFEPQGQPAGARDALLTPAPAPVPVHGLPPTSPRAQSPQGPSVLPPTTTVPAPDLTPDQPPPMAGPPGGVETGPDLPRFAEPGSRMGQPRRTAPATGPLRLPATPPPVGLPSVPSGGAALPGVTLPPADVTPLPASEPPVIQGGGPPATRLPERGADHAAANRAAADPGANWESLVTMRFQKPVTALAFSPDGQRLAVGCDHSLYLRSLSRLADEAAILDGHEGTVSAVLFSPDGSRLLSGSADRTVRIWDVATGKKVALLSAGEVVTALALTPDGRMVIAGAVDGSIRIWDTASGKQVRALTDAPRPITALTVSPDGHLLASGTGDAGNNRDGKVKLWDLASGAIVAQFQGQAGAVTQVAFSADGRLLYTCGGRELRAWDLTHHSHRFVRVIEAGAVSLTGSPDGRQLVVGDGRGAITFLSASDGSQLGQGPGAHDDAITSVVFRPDGLVLATGGRDQTVKLWRRLAAPGK